MPEIGYPESAGQWLGVEAVVAKAVLPVLERNGLTDNNATLIAVATAEHQIADLDKAITAQMNHRHYSGPGYWTAPDHRLRWARTTFGTTCLAYIEAAARDLASARRDDSDT